MTANQIINAAINTNHISEVVGDEVVQRFYLVGGYMVVANYNRRSTRTTYDIQSIPSSLS